MTSLEVKLASLLELIGQARAARDPLVLAALLQRKDAICAALAAPEQSWDEAPERASSCSLRREAVPPVA
jgi:hypothetical protein